jgi:hypothetical protein
MNETDAPTPAELAVIQAKLDEFVGAGLIEIIEYDAAADEGTLRFHPAWFRLMHAGRTDLIDRAFADAGVDLVAARRSLEREAERLWPDSDATVYGHG